MREQTNKTLKKLFKERFDKIMELTDERNFDSLKYCFKGDSGRKRFDDFENRIKLFEKIKSGDMKLEETKKLQNKFKSNLNEVVRGRHKSKKHKIALQSIKML